MFFRRIYPRGKRFKPSWQSYLTYVAVIAGCLLAVEFNVLNVFYFVVAVLFLVNDLVVAGWQRLRGKRRARRNA